MEVLASSVILAIGAMAAVKVFTAGSRGRALSRHEAVARRIVERRLESLHAGGLENLPDCPGTEGCRAGFRALKAPLAPDDEFPCTQTVHAPSLEDRFRVDDDGRYRVDTVVFPHPDPEQRTEARVVSVSACWVSQRGRVHEYRARSLVREQR